jgi:hypothetical protein
MIRRFRLAGVVVLLLSSVPITPSQALPITPSCTPGAQISPVSQEKFVGENAIVEILVNTCWVEAESIVFEVHGPHPYAENFDQKSNIEQTYTYGGIASGLDQMSVTAIIGSEVMHATAEVSWTESSMGPLAPLPNPDAEEVTIAGAIASCWAQSDLPHHAAGSWNRFGPNYGEISAHARTYCYANRPMLVQSILSMLINNAWVNVYANSSDREYFYQNRWQVETRVATICRTGRTYRFRISSFHKAWWANGSTASGWTHSYNNLTCRQP